MDPGGGESENRDALGYGCAPGINAVSYYEFPSGQAENIKIVSGFGRTFGAAYSGRGGISFNFNAAHKLDIAIWLRRHTLEGWPSNNPH